MNDALRVNDDVDPCHFDVEKPAGLDHFEAFVEQGGGIDGDLGAHFPSRVAKRLVLCDFWELLRGSFAEGAAGRGEDQPADIGNVERRTSAFLPKSSVEA